MRSGPARDEHGGHFGARSMNARRLVGTKFAHRDGSCRRGVRATCPRATVAFDGTLKVYDKLKNLTAFKLGF